MTLPTYLVSTRWVEAGSLDRGCGKEQSWHLRADAGHLLPPQFPSKVSLAESDRNQTSFMFNVASTSKDGTMLPTKSQVFPSRRDDRVILHFDCRYIALCGTIYNMQLADSAAHR